MHPQQRMQALAIIFVTARSMWPSLTSAQITCIYPPPEGGNEIVAAMQHKISGMRLQDFQPALHTEPRPEGRWKALVLLIDFPDYRWHTTSDSNFANADSFYTPPNIYHMLFSQQVYADRFSASSYTGSLRDFYDDNSYRRFDIDGEIAGWFTAPQGMRYYVNYDGRPGTADDFGFGAYPNNAQRLAEEAIIQADAAVDFSQYDNDGNGSVDALFIVHAGPGAEYLYCANRAAHYNYMWSHFGGIRGLPVDNVWVTTYALVPEDGAIGVFCHEFGHALGLPDLYDVDGSSEGVGEWCLMGSGSWCFKNGDRLGTSPSYFSAWSRLRLGWATAVNFDEGEIIRLQPAEISEKILVLRTPAMPAGEYFLLENRQPLGFDAGLTRRQKDFALLAPSGLMIYHIDEAAGGQAADRRRLVDVEEASPYVNGGQIFEHLDRRREAPLHLYLDRGNRGDNGDPFPGFAAWTDDLSDFLGARRRDHFDDFSTPSARTNNGTATGIAVNDIRLDGEDVILKVQLQGVTSVTAENLSLPRETTLYALPNPTHGNFRLIGRVQDGVGRIVVRLVDILGRDLETRQILAPVGGRFELVWTNAQSLPAGIYFAVIETQQFRAATKVLLLH